MIPGIPSAKCTRGPEYTRGDSRQLWYFSTLTHSLPTLELARELRYEWSSSLLVTLWFPCVVDDEMRREPPFIGGEEGFLGKCFIPSWKAPNRPPNRRLGALNLDDTLGPDMGKAASVNTRKMGPRGPSGGAGTPGVWPHPN